jgi:myosin heavy subunit
MDSNTVEKKKRTRKPKVLPTEETPLAIEETSLITKEATHETPVILKGNILNIKTTLNTIIDEFLDEQNKQYSSLKESNSFLEGKIKSLEEQLENKTHNMDYLKELEQKVESLNLINKGLLEENEKLKGIHNGYNKMYVELQEQFVIKVNLIETLENKLKETKKEYDKFKSEYNKKIDSEIKSFKNVSIMNTYLEEIKTLKNDITILNKQLVSSKNLLEASRKENKELVQKLKLGSFGSSDKQLSISNVILDNLSECEETEETEETQQLVKETKANLEANRKETLKEKVSEKVKENQMKQKKLEKPEEELGKLQELEDDPKIFKETEEPQEELEQLEEESKEAEEPQEELEQLEEVSEEAEEDQKKVTEEELEEESEEAEQELEEPKEQLKEESEEAEEELEEPKEQLKEESEEAEETEVTNNILNVETLDIIEVDELEYYLDLDSNILEKDTLKVVGKLTDDGDAIFN